MIAPADEGRVPEPAVADRWLSRLTLNPRSPEARRDLRDAAAMHARLCSLFVRPRGGARRAVRSEFDLLYRIETPDGRAWVLVQSRIRPDLAALPAHYAASASKPIGSALDALRAGGLYRFRLRANPVHSPGRSARQAGRRRAGIRGSDEALAWLRRQGDSAGFEIMGVAITPEDPVRARRRPDENWMTFTSHLFDGSLRVMDPDRCREAIAEGIGRGRSYGLGLLSLSAR